MPSIWVNDASTGTCTLPDGRTCTFNGSSVATLSDGSSIYVGGRGPVFLPDASSVSLVLNPASGSSTSAQISVFAPAGVPATPSGTVTLLINGVPYTTATLANGTATIAVPSSAFPASGTYTLAVQYSGDGNFSPSASAPQTFVANLLLPSTTALVVSPASGFSMLGSVTVSGAGPKPTGTVTLFLEYNATGPPPLPVPGPLSLVGGTASFNINGSTFIAVTGFGSGDFTITATYNGDATYSPSTSTSQPFHLNSL